MLDQNLASAPAPNLGRPAKTWNVIRGSGYRPEKKYDYRGNGPDPNPRKLGGKM